QPKPKTPRDASTIPKSPSWFSFLPVCGRFLVTLLAVDGALGLVVEPLDSVFSPVCGRFLVTLLAVASTLGLAVEPLDSVFSPVCGRFLVTLLAVAKIGRASCRERVSM